MLLSSRGRLKLRDVLAELALQPFECSGAGHEHAIARHDAPGRHAPDRLVGRRQRLSHLQVQQRAAALSFRAPATAASTAAALSEHSTSSAFGSLSATMPAPACTEARPSGVATSVRIVMAVSRFPEKSMYPTTPA